ncbi:LysR family transcriptional regulator [Cupriavidus necator H16]|uniref:LysR family transcriptional regulator n=1 Tax=Cupriavidus necator (strain ATCC 17699 / DSM 428 / KCTC 22496 / NCIMB 10442 / H16 / Stanier 337) TaxID=381666 RepID=A0AAE6DJE5_CUPNH|nr:MULTISPECIES: LysR family transcriptional regulator [Cupriavidus]QCC04000.1 LysR family transcriptional regulator [Cupriavidus necator H16]QQB81060.1 LysR family transcriptional regulator [Cupriavidus necator]WKA42897.1 LysR family transcriptional regulator [Cupriavidus necator]
MAPGYPDELAAFASIAREQSFRGAAAKLGVVQPALSQMVRSDRGGLESRSVLPFWSLPWPDPSVCWLPARQPSL